MTGHRPRSRPFVLTSAVRFPELAAVVRLVELYVTQHNSVLPHATLGGRTPDEGYFGMATEVPDQLKEARANARKARIEANRARSCDECRSGRGVASSAAANG
jgi:hypothetical protein